MYLKHLLSAFMAIICFQAFSQTPYGVYQIPFQTVSPSQATTLVLGDDQMSGMVPIGFSFSFFGTGYDSLSVSSNGYVTFNQTTAGENSTFAVNASIPDAYAPLNAIMLSWFDLDPYLTGTISYGVLGEAPNRVFIVQYSQVPLFACSQDLYTGQLQLFEGTNNIEVHITSNRFALMEVQVVGRIMPSKEFKMQVFQRRMQFQVEIIQALGKHLMMHGVSIRIQHLSPFASCLVV